MPSQIKIIHAHEFIKATPEGPLDLAQTKTVLMEIAAASAPSDDYDIILDTRKASAQMSETDLWWLAVELCKFRKVFSRKMAVLCPLERFDFTKFFALCSQNRGFQVSAFTTLGEAIEWLIAT